MEPLPEAEQEKWHARAKAAVEAALFEMDDVDVIPGLSYAMACLRVANGELPPFELDELELACTCPPDLLDRGGFRGGCPVHALTY
jgi:hypothetical protein